MTEQHSSASSPDPGNDSRARSWLIAVFVVGAVLQLWLWWRSVWIYWDQAALYGQALDWLETGKLGALGKSMSGGLRGPAGLLQILVGAPLLVWPTARASSLVVVVFHFAGGLLLVRVLSRLLSPRFALSFLLVYWLAPWRLYLGSFVWEPNYLFLPAAAHLWACAHLRRVSSLAEGSRYRIFAVSAGLGAVVSVAPQLHPSGIVLAALTLLLWWKRAISPTWQGLGSGLGLGALPAMPALVALAKIAGGFRSLAPVSGVSLGQLEWLPLSTTIKAAVYWLRLPSADIGRRLTETTFCGTAQTDFGLLGGGLPCASLWLLIALANLSILVCVVASVRYFRHRSLDISTGGADEGSAWLRQYVLLSLAALLLVAFVSPIRIQGWHTIVILHAACVPVASWLSSGLFQRESGAAKRLLVFAIASFLALRLVVVGILGVAHPMFLEPGRPEMLEEMLPADLRFLAPRP